MVRILLADDHPLFADALRLLIERHIPDSTLVALGDLESAHRELSSGKRYDLVILDLQMPGVKGFEGVERTLARFPEVPLVLISGADTTANVARAVQLGAKGFFPKTMAPNVLAAALQVVVAGGTYVPASYAQGTPAPRAGDGSEAVAGLTLREREVLTLLAAGHANKEIARTLDLQEITIKLHVRNIFRKLSVRNRVEATNAARLLEIVPPPHE